MPRTNFNELLDAGVHFGHLRRKWNPAMAPYIFMERNGIHIIDLEKTEQKIEEAASALKQIAKSGKKILFVATKKQAKDIVAEKVKQTNMPYVTERWPGGMLTNFPTIRKAVKKMATIDKMATDGTFTNMSKREKLQITRQRAKLEKMLGSIADLTRLPAVLFVVDITKEYIAVREAEKLGIPVIAMVDTNSDPNAVEFPIPANDDASKSISLIVDIMCKAVEEGLNERKTEKEKESSGKEKRGSKGTKAQPKRVRSVKVESSDNDEDKAVSTEVQSKDDKPKDDKPKDESAKSKEEKPKEEGGKAKAESGQAKEEKTKDEGAESKDDKPKDEGEKTKEEKSENESGDK